MKIGSSNSGACNDRSWIAIKKSIKKRIGILTKVTYETNLPRYELRSSIREDI